MEKSKKQTNQILTPVFKTSYKASVIQTVWQRRDTQEIKNKLTGMYMVN